MAAKFKIGDEVITVHGEWPKWRKELGQIVDMDKLGNGRYQYKVRLYNLLKINYYMANEINKYINNIEDLL